MVVRHPKPRKGLADLDVVCPYYIVTLNLNFKQDC